MVRYKSRVDEDKMPAPKMSTEKASPAVEKPKQKQAGSMPVGGAVDPAKLVEELFPEGGEPNYHDMISILSAMTPFQHHVFKGLVSNFINHSHPLSHDIKQAAGGAFKRPSHVHQNYYRDLMKTHSGGHAAEMLHREHMDRLKNGYKGSGLWDSVKSVFKKGTEMAKKGLSGGLKYGKIISNLLQEGRKWAKIVVPTIEAFLGPDSSVTKFAKMGQAGLEQLDTAVGESVEVGKALQSGIEHTEQVLSGTGAPVTKGFSGTQAIMPSTRGSSIDEGGRLILE